mmetsp:Transcript_10125/g.27159  ORF Transcript_10125/g.27159 Transcript_10125/m.27159 type:complete len:253 (+) Transcript_10125:359-1117(+)
MAQNDSFPMKTLLSTSSPANRSALPNTDSQRGSNAAVDGRSTIATPANPAAVASQRPASTFSERKNMASSSVNMGIVKLSVVTAAMGAMESPYTYSPIAPSSMTDLATCSGTRSVLKVDGFAIMNGSMLSAANANRRNTTCAACKDVPTNFMMTSFPTPTTWCARYQSSATTNGAAAAEAAAVVDGSLGVSGAVSDVADTGGAHALRDLFAPARVVEAAACRKRAACKTSPPSSKCVVCKQQLLMYELLQVL